MSHDGESANFTDAQQELNSFWGKAADEIRSLGTEDFKTSVLPLARIKKIMKLDEDVKMISAEAPVLFAKAAEIFIHELTLRAWVHTEDNKRRTLQRNDIAMAITKFDQFDFLIDIVPRDELKQPKREDQRNTGLTTDTVQYYLQLAQQQTNPTGAQAAVTNQLQTLQIVQPNGQVQTIAVIPSGVGLPIGEQLSLSPTSGTLRPAGNQAQTSQQPVTILSASGAGTASQPQILHVQQVGN
ncbi:unnamed protein product [Darwinula stevensoni]|uniref:Nuclear transcription factor Y subunit gamma n=1 Tax=Darwinula stevensoni TaxID=69355 RepID=A0A7R9A9Y3_9CRUS|nr:unnamed protein product [Darwinula stevensoni]CAG0897796.1 unnamed protein product [Darwinula stevensoni]